MDESRIRQSKRKEDRNKPDDVREEEEAQILAALYE